MTIIEVGELIRKRRNMLGIKQEDLAEMSDVGIRTLHQIEAGIGNPAFSTLEKVLDILGLDITIQIKSN